MGKTFSRQTENQDSNAKHDQNQNIARLLLGVLYHFGNLFQQLGQSLLILIHLSCPDYETDSRKWMESIFGVGLLGWENGRKGRNLVEIFVKEVALGIAHYPVDNIFPVLQCLSVGNEKVLGIKVK